MSSQTTSWSVGIIVPACNEEDTIEACIRSLLVSLRVASIDRSWVVVVADNCEDRTAQRARRALGSAGEVLEVRLRSAGAARQVGVAHVLLRLAAVDPLKVWLANTDADTTVSESWIRVQLALADEGVSAVAGIVRLTPGGCAAAYEVYRKTYFTNPEGTHTHVHGANLSMRADAYKDAGGWSDLSLAEDHCLWSRLRNKGWRLHTSAICVVTTSARLDGRAKGGFADTLRICVEALNAEL